MQEVIEIFKITGWKFYFTAEKLTYAHKKVWRTIFFSHDKWLFLNDVILIIIKINFDPVLSIVINIMELFISSIILVKSVAIIL